MVNKYLYLNTIGCQMNVYDSERIAMRLAELGYQQTSSLDRADLVIANTCTIRAKAEQKAFSFLGRLARLKKKKPGLITAIGGCVAQQEGKKIFKRIPYLDLVFGTQAIDRLPSLVQKIEKKRCRIVDIELTDKPDFLETEDSIAPASQVSRFVTIMRGCDNFCSYCVVPYVRGRETSRHPDVIVSEIRQLAESGLREVTLLGQNVNSYGKKEGLCSFTELLARISQIEQLLRIRFTTSHPKDFDEDLINAFRSNDKLCDHLHLPVQSGSNQVLKRMNRKYTKELYLDKVAKLRDTCPDIAITSDIIVGFPGESEADFDETLDLIRTIEFDGLFAFKYSDRPNAPAAKFEEKVSDQQMKERLQILLDLQETFTKKKNKALVGTCLSILAEGFSKRQSSGNLNQPHQAVQWTGRTSTNKIVNFYQGVSPGSCDGITPGQLVDVKIEKAYSHSLWGKPVEPKAAGDGLKGEKSYAA
ncbi:MAG: tRNA (N6-isopentenyl adenosine(37)-C2)-methylthiotransferase MiaB [Desulfobacteraceae bacterium]|nr:tRNA (N6-isopentenyl adenosine(37)-C2)-methylthiotransferase MiaB [Desulfobacteraceae bacterium]